MILKHFVIATIVISIVLVRSSIITEKPEKIYLFTNIRVSFIKINSKVMTNRLSLLQQLFPYML